MNLTKSSDLAKSLKGTEYVENIPALSSDNYLGWRLQNDPEFFFTKLLKIISKGKLKPLNPNRHQKIVLNIYRAMKIAGLPVRIIILKARRMGMSTAVEGLGTQEATLRPYRRIKVVANDEANAEYIFNMSRVFYEELHASLKPMKRYSSRNELTFENPDDKARTDNPGLRSSITVATAGGRQVGRGQEVNFLHLSEVAFYDNAGNLSSGLLQTVDYAPDTSVFLESTANGTGNWFHDQYWSHKEGKEELIKNLIADSDDVDALVSHLESFQGTVGYIPLFFPWHEFADYQMPITSKTERNHIQNNLDEEETELIEDFKVTLEQLKWRRARLNELARTAEGISPLDLFRQEYPASDREAFIATGRGIFDAKKLSQMKTSPPLWKGRMASESFPRTSRRKPYKPIMMEHPFGELTIYHPAKPGHQYAIGVDVAFAEKGRDFSCMEVIDKETFSHCAEWHGKSADVDELGRFAMMLGEIYNRATVAIERNNMGIGSLIALRDTGYPNIYMPKTYAQQEENPLDRLGWETTKNTKALAIATMAELIRKGRVSFNSEPLIGECLSFQVNERGQLEAQEGRHDDRVMATAICLQTIIDYPPVKEVKTLQQLLHEEDLQNYGIPEEQAWDPVLGDVLP